MGGKRLVQLRFLDIRRRRGSFFLDLGEQPGLDRRGCPLSLYIIMGQTAGLKDYGAQLGDAAATSVVEADKRKAGPGHRILQERDRRCHWQAMFAAPMQKSADQTVAAVSVIITAARVQWPSTDFQRRGGNFARGRRCRRGTRRNCPHTGAPTAAAGPSRVPMPPRSSTYAH